jgi:hypothetical protein
MKQYHNPGPSISFSRSSLQEGPAPIIAPVVVEAVATRFRSSGVHNLEEYKPPSGTPQQPSSAAPRSAPEPSRRHWVNYGVSAENMGFKLLKLAGWREGTGLGASKQGRKEPILPSSNPGNTGLGFDDRARQQQGQRKRQRDAPPAPRYAAASAAGSAAAQQPEDTDAHHHHHQQQQQQQQRRRGALIAGLVAQELASEAVETKVKRHKQVMRQEAEDARGRAIHHYLSSVLNDHDGTSNTDSNPLLRRNKLSALNPLLD